MFQTGIRLFIIGLTCSKMAVLPNLSWLLNHCPYTGFPNKGLKVDIVKIPCGVKNEDMTLFVLRIIFDFC